jgi:hypothetical protein
MLTERCSEKYVKTLIGKTEMEDALKRLDKLTQEEARMAAAQNLKATHAVDERVKELRIRWQPSTIGWLASMTVSVKWPMWIKWCQ